MASILEVDNLVKKYGDIGAEVLSYFQYPPSSSGSI